jgi:ankyrin repeat protein
VNSSDREGRTPLHLAAGAGSGLIVDRLLDAGAEAGAKDLSGRTPRDDAVAAGHSQVAGRLRQRGRGWRFPFFGR